MRKAAGAGLAHGGDDARGCVEDEDAVGEGDDDGWRDGGECGGDEVEAEVDRERERGQGVEQGGLRCHDDGRKGGEVGL